MANLHLLEPSSVYAEISALKNRISNELDNMDNNYNTILANIDHMDGSTNATFREAVERNRQKSIEAASILEQLLLFIENATRIREAADRQQAEFIQQTLEHIEDETWRRDADNRRTQQQQAQRRHTENMQQMMEPFIQ